MSLKIKPDPDFSRIEKVLRRNGVPDRVPFYELFSDIEEKVLDILGQPAILPMDDKTPGYDTLRRHITYMYCLGYDYINCGGNGFSFPQKERPQASTTDGGRSYVQGALHTIGSYEDFEKYPWQDMSQIDYSILEKVGEILPAGMKVISGFSGILENVMWLLGYEGISFMLYENPGLVRDMFDAVGGRIINYMDNCASFDSVGAVQIGEDMGYRNQTMLSPDIYRKYLFPFHRKLVETVHRYGKPVILHSCGNLEEIMEDIIACGWDAKHSFEDAIEPVWVAKEKYGRRIAILGGFDMDKICRMSVEDIRRHTSHLMEKCMEGSGWALGTGNSVADYIPVENFLAMLEEGYTIGRYQS